MDVLVTLAYLAVGLQPKRSSAGRDLPSSNYRRSRGSLKVLAASSSTFVESALKDNSTPPDEVAEYEL